MKWVYVLRLLMQDPATGDTFWDEAVRSTPVDFPICIESVVKTVDALDKANVQYEVYCEEVPKETTETDEKE